MHPFTPDEEQRLLQELAGGAEARCPRCQGALERTDVPPRKDVPYVRDRVWVLCSRCGGSTVVDRHKME